MFYKKRFNNNGDLNLARDFLNDFSPDVFNRPYVTRSESNMTKNPELKGRLKTFY